mmetsp:Transcript_6574/g.9554  ORF Transcript_6574/g.9554 Transcript_6574/m.9554 type:complete len:1090 (+) Transcript_6574:327-3596(+)
MNYSELMGSGPLNIQILEQAVLTIYGGNMHRPPQEMKSAQEILTALQDDNESWKRTKEILDQTQFQEVKYFALQILEKAVKLKWNVMHENERNGLKGYILSSILNMSDTKDGLHSNSLALPKYNQVLVEIVKQEWPQNWDFINELIDASKRNQFICENNIQILKLLSEDIFDFAMNNMVAEKIDTLRSKFKSQFSEIYYLCEFVLEKASEETLVIATLQIMQKLLPWIPSEYIMDTNFLGLLVSKFMPVPFFRNDVVACLAMVADIKEKKYNHQFGTMFTQFIDVLSSNIMPVESNFVNRFNLNPYERVFIIRVAIFLATFLKNHRAILEGSQWENYIVTGHKYLLEFSNIKDKELLQTWLEYFNHLASELYKCKKENYTPNQGLVLQNDASRVSRYSELLNQVRIVVVENMVKPEEVIIVENELGVLEKQRYKQVEIIDIYRKMRGTLIYLTNLDPNDMQNVLVGRLQFVAEKEWSWESLNTTCWAVGAISGAMSDSDEERFLVSVIRLLLHLCSNKNGKENKAVVASNIMHVVGQYPRFLQAHWRFLKTVLTKLFEFMHELFPGVREMACETFLKLTRSCKSNFVQHIRGETLFINLVLENLPSLISNLEPYHTCTFYEAVGQMIDGSKDKREKRKWLAKLFDRPNNTWKKIIHNWKRNPAHLEELECTQELLHLLKLNVAVARSTGHDFSSQLETIFKSGILDFYVAYSQAISREISVKGPSAAHHVHVLYMRDTKREMLHLVEVYIKNSKENKASAVIERFIKPLLHATLLDYGESVPDAKDHGVICLFNSSLKKFKEHMRPHMPVIMETILTHTVPIVNKDMVSFPEHRRELFQFIRSVTKYCIGAYGDMPPFHFDTVMNCILWAVQHHERTLYETGLMTLVDIVRNVKNMGDFASHFYAHYYIPIIIHTFQGITDTFHMSGFRHHVSILHMIFKDVALNQVRVQLLDENKKPHNFRSNVDFVRQFCINSLRNELPNVAEQKIVNFLDLILRLSSSGSENKIVNPVRDFLVEIKEFSFSPEQKSLYYEQQDHRHQMRANEERNVPGMMGPTLTNPHVVPEQSDMSTYQDAPSIIPQIMVNHHHA